MAAPPAAAEAPLDWGWGVIVNFKDLKEGSERKRKGKRDGEAGVAVADYTVDVLLKTRVRHWCCSIAVAKTLLPLRLTSQ